MASGHRQPSHQGQRGAIPSQQRNQFVEEPSHAYTTVEVVMGPALDLDLFINIGKVGLYINSLSTRSPQVHPMVAGLHNGSTIMLVMEEFDRRHPRRSSVGLRVLNHPQGINDQHGFEPLIMRDSGEDMRHIWSQAFITKPPITTLNLKNYLVCTGHVRAGWPYHKTPWTSSITNASGSKMEDFVLALRKQGMRFHVLLGRIGCGCREP